MSGTETLVGGDLNYECCKSRGAVAALDANTGKVLWVTQSVQEPLREAKTRRAGKGGDLPALPSGTRPRSMRNVDWSTSAQGTASDASRQRRAIPSLPFAWLTAK